MNEDDLGSAKDLSGIIERLKIPLALGAVGLVLIIGGMFLSSGDKKPANFPKESIVAGTKTISVDVSGAVKNPAVYHIQDGSRVEDAIKAAGGFAESANQEFVSKYLNLAQKLSDGNKVYVPFDGETAPAILTGGGLVAGSATSKININTASQSDLEALSGIGPVTASKIISGRPYSKPEDLVNNKILGKSTFEKIKDSLTAY